MGSRQLDEIVNLDSEMVSNKLPFADMTSKLTNMGDESALHRQSIPSQT